jgi:glycerol kinase
MLKLFNVPASLLPQVKDSAGDFGVTDEAIFGAPIRIAGVAGDQQAAAFGQACFKAGDVKSTYGTGCFALVNTRQGRAAFEKQAPRHVRLPHQEEQRLCDRGQHLHCRRGRAMAARCCRRDPLIRRSRSTCAHGQGG